MLNSPCKSSPLCDQIVDKTAMSNHEDDEPGEGEDLEKLSVCGDSEGYNYEPNRTRVVRRRILRTSKFKLKHLRYSLTK